ncbi:MAG: hypothetical protein WA064_04735 [Candidatus Moraniibacteriota bacterium]
MYERKKITLVDWLLLPVAIILNILEYLGWQRIALLVVTVLLTRFFWVFLW